MNQYHKLYTAQDSAVVFIDHQPQMLFGVANADRATLINNVVLLAKVAKEFGVPAVLTSVETEGFSGYVWPQLLDVFPGQPVVERSSMNSWDDAGFRKAIEATGKKNIIMTGLWTEVCVTWPTIEMLGCGHSRSRLVARIPARRGGRPRHRTDGGLRLRRAIPPGNGPAGVDGRLPARHRRLEKCLADARFVAFPLLRRSAARIGQGAGANLLRAFLE